MRSTRCAAAFLALTFTLAAAPAARPVRMNPKHAWLYVTGETSRAVDIYDLSIFGAPFIGRITKAINQPFGLALDPNGTLYVVNQRARGGGHGFVTLYPARATAPSLTLAQGLIDPQSVAVASDGDVYVANRGNSSEPAGIAVFPAGQTTMSKYITSALIQKPIQDFFDAAGDLYFSDPLTGVSVIAAGSTTPVSLGLQGLAQATGIALDPKTGDLFVDNYDYNGAGGYELLAYAPGDVEPARILAGNKAGYLLTMGRVGKALYLFDPTFYSNEIYVYKHDARRPWTIVSTGVAADATAFKPAGVP
jgi:DNA-binding beta-propeller fold protein YncE